MIMTDLQGLLLSIMTGVGYSVIQSAIFRLPRIRQKFNIGRLPPTLTSFPSVFDTLKFVYKNLRGFFARYRRPTTQAKRHKRKIRRS